MNFEIITDAECDECHIWDPHRHITIIDTTPEDPLEAEVQRAMAANRRERRKAGEPRDHPFGGETMLNMLEDIVLDYLYRPLPSPLVEMARRSEEEE